MNLKRWTPSYFRRGFHLSKRYLFDLWKGYTFQFARNHSLQTNFPYQLCKTQLFKNKSGLAAKRHNLQLAAIRIASVQINPGELFSFWRVVGRASTRRGFKVGRTIVDGQLSTSVGGGLCQLSGLLYFISLEAQLEIVERHAHSLDLYDESTRYTPLGSDATVAYGYKDLRIRNNFDFPIRFLFEVEEEQVSVMLCSAAEIFRKKVVFDKRVSADGWIEVSTFVDDEACGVSLYGRMV